MPKVSIIVPVYNTAKYLKQCIDSLTNQTLNEIEIIIINDCSPDNSSDIITSYKDKRIKIINHNKNMGIGKSRNDGIKKATGKYIAFVDSDDFVDLNMYEKYYNFANANNLDFVTGFYNKVLNNKIINFKNDYFEITNIHKNKNLINLIDYGPCNKIFKREIITKNNIKFDENKKFEDIPFVVSALCHSENVGHINDYLYNYRIRGNSETTTIDKRTKDIFDILEKVNKIFSQLERNSLEVEYFNITQITRYMLKQKYQKNKNLKLNFINQGFEILNNKYPNWKNNKYYKKENIFKRIIKSNKILLTIYCNM